MVYLALVFDPREGFFMGLINGAVACTRFNVVSLPDDPDFELVPYRAIAPGSNLRQKEGFIPFEPEESYEIGAKRWAFRVRIDKVQLDATVVNERLKELVKVETEQVGPPSPKARRRLKILAEEELMAHPMPRSKIIECVLEETVLYVGTVSKSHLGLVLELLKRIGVEVEFKTPWLDAGQEEEPSEWVELKEPGQSIWGCRFLKALLEDPDTMVEPEKGSVKLVANDGAKVSLSGPVLMQLDGYIDKSAQLMSAKILSEGFNFTFDGLSYRISGMALENYKSKHWTEQLDLRMEKIKQLWEWLDDKYRHHFQKELGFDS